MNASLFLSRIDGPFHPATQQQFNQYAEHLGWVVGCHHIDSREMLARIYHYRNAFELEQVLKTPGMPGPFDDAISLDIRGTDKVRAAIAARNEQAMQIILDRIGGRLGNTQARLTLQRLSALKLFSSPLAHEAAFRTLAGPKTHAAFGGLRLGLLTL